MRRSSTPTLGFVSLVLVSIALGCSSALPCDSGTCTTGTGGASTTTGTGGATGGAGGSGGGTFSCKGLTCLRGQEVCNVTNDLGGDSGECSPLPVACQGPAAHCTCFGDLTPCTCQQLPAGDFATFCDKTM